MDDSLRISRQPLELTSIIMRRHLTLFTECVSYTLLVFARTESMLKLHSVRVRFARTEVDDVGHGRFRLLGESTRPEELLE